MHPIPPVIDPHTHYWKQPDRKNILVNDTYAVMSQTTFDTLEEYNKTDPAYVYEGRMWKRLHNNIYYLCWYGEFNISFGKVCMREITILDWKTLTGVK